MNIHLFSLILNMYHCISKSKKKFTASLRSENLTDRLGSDGLHRHTYESDAGNKLNYFQLII